MDWCARPTRTTPRSSPLSGIELQARAVEQGETEKRRIRKLQRGEVKRGRRWTYDALHDYLNKS